LQRYPLQLVVVGEAGKENESYSKNLRKMAEGRENIRFVGWLGPADIYKHLDMADLAVFPAGQSILWQQAIAMGLPLIVGDIGHQDISYLNLYDNIIILRQSDISSEKFTAAIERVISDPARMRSMSAGATKVADERLDWNKLILKTLQFN
jgi:glycosyltransferase involved in cell wall biosynthesis